MASELLFLPQHFTLTQKRLVAYAIGLITKNHRDMCPDEFLKTKFVIHAKYFQEAFQLGNAKSGEIYKDLKEYLMINKTIVFDDKIKEQIKNLYNSIDVVISKCEADSILFSWGL